MRIGQVSEGSEGWDRETGRKGCWRFDGLTSLVAVYEEIEDGAEIIWREYQGKAVRSIQARVRTKQQLEAFDDSGEES